MKGDKLGEWLQAQQRLGAGLGEEWQFPLLCKLPLPDPSSPVITDTDVLPWHIPTHEEGSIWEFLFVISYPQSLGSWSHVFLVLLTFTVTF